MRSKWAMFYEKGKDFAIVRTNINTNRIFVASLNDYTFC